MATTNLVLFKMNSKVYKWCAVPQCNNTSIKTPKKLFIHVPTKKNIRDKWLQLAGRDPADVSISSAIYFCKDHFDLPKDMDNYMQYHVMGSVSQVRMKPDCVPTKFDCQPHRRKQKNNLKQPYIAKKRKKVAIEECGKDLERRSIVTNHLEDKDTSTTSKDYEMGAQCCECNACNKHISGFRYTCVQCADYDLCAACEASGAHALHYVLRVPADRPYSEVESVLQRLRHALLGGVQPVLPAGGDGAGAGDAPFADDVKVEVKVEMDDAGPDPLQEVPELADYEPTMTADQITFIHEEVDIEIKRELESDGETGETETSTHSGYRVHPAGVATHSGEVTTVAARKRKADCSGAKKRLLIEIDAGSIMMSPGGVDALRFQGSTHKSTGSIDADSGRNLPRRESVKTGGSGSKISRCRKKAKTKKKQ